jgi:dnd system-associated protein 4
MIFSSAFATKNRIMNELEKENYDSSKNIKFHIFRDQVINIIALSNSEYNLDFIDNTEEIINNNINIFEKCANAGLESLNKKIDDTSSDKVLEAIIELIQNQFLDNDSEDELDLDFE